MTFAIDVDDDGIPEASFPLKWVLVVLMIVCPAAHTLYFL